MAATGGIREYHSPEFCHKTFFITMLLSELFNRMFRRRGNPLTDAFLYAVAAERFLRHFIEMNHK
jgi:hypothetical protein